MSIRQLAWAVLCAASCLLGPACAREGRAQQASQETRSPEGEQPPPGPPCGGFAGLGCPEGHTCVDDPRDDCDPQHSGADCMGLCVKEEAPEEAQPEPKPAPCPEEDASRRYVSRDPRQCKAIRFFCEAGQRPFFNDCGCGCEPEPGP